MKTNMKIINHLLFSILLSSAVVSCLPAPKQKKKIENFSKESDVLEEHSQKEYEDIYLTSDINKSQDIEKGKISQNTLTQPSTQSHNFVGQEPLPSVKTTVPTLDIEITCLRSAPNYAKICSGDDKNLLGHSTASLKRILVRSCTNSRKCEYICNSDRELRDGYCLKPRGNVSSRTQTPTLEIDIKCLRSAPNYAKICSGDDQNLLGHSTASLKRILVKSCTNSRKCEYICNSDRELRDGYCLKPKSGSSTRTTRSRKVTPVPNTPESRVGRSGRNIQRSVTLYRYKHIKSGNHVLTLHMLDISFQYEAGVNVYDPNAPQPANTRPIYGCLIGGRDHMVSPRQDCEGSGHRLLEKLGYVGLISTAGSIPLYRGFNGSDHLITSDSSCEGYNTHCGLIGYALSMSSTPPTQASTTPASTTGSSIKISMNRVPGVYEYSFTVKVKSISKRIENCFSPQYLKNAHAVEGNRYTFVFNGICKSNNNFSINLNDIEYYEIVSAGSNNWSDESTKKVTRIKPSVNQREINFNISYELKDLTINPIAGYKKQKFTGHFYGYPRSHVVGSTLYHAVSINNPKSFPLLGSQSYANCNNSLDGLKTIHLVKQNSAYSLGLSSPVMIDQDCAFRMENPEILVRGNNMLVSYHYISAPNACIKNGKQGRKWQLIYKDVVNYQSSNPVISGRKVLYEVCLENHIDNFDGFWEPYLYMDKNQNLNLLYANDMLGEGRIGCAQKIHQRTFYDSANLSNNIDRPIGNCSGNGRRDGMPVIAKLNASIWYMVFESLYHQSGVENGDVIILTSVDGGLTWGNRRVIVKSKDTPGSTKAGTPYIQIKNGIGYVSYSLETGGAFTQLRVRALDLNGLGYFKEYILDKRLKFPVGFGGLYPEVGSLFWGSINIVNNDLFFFGAAFWGGEFTQVFLPVSSFLVDID